MNLSIVRNTNRLTGFTCYSLYNDFKCGGRVCISNHQTRAEAFKAGLALMMEGSRLTVGSSEEY